MAQRKPTTPTVIRVRDDQLVWLRKQAARERRTVVSLLDEAVLLLFEKRFGVCFRCRQPLARKSDV